MRSGATCRARWRAPSWDVHSEFFKRSTIWVVDFRYDGRPRRWLRAFGPEVSVQQAMAEELRDLHGARAQLLSVRPATEEEETQYLRGDGPLNLICSTGVRCEPAGGS